MTTALQGAYTAFTCTNLSGTYNWTEGGGTISFSPMILTTFKNYSKVYTLTMTVSAPSQAGSVFIENASASLNGNYITKSGNVYTLSSEYINEYGVKTNNWAYFKIALQSLFIQADHSDVGESFSIAVSLTDGTTTRTGTISVITISSPDVLNNNQSLTAPMAMNAGTLVGLGGANVAINDANQANKTYRTTFTVNDDTEGSLTSDVYLNAGGLTFQKSLVFTGTQAAVNSAMAGITIHSYNPDFWGLVTVSYLQEVLTSTETNLTPYNQETGLLQFNIAYTAPYTAGSDLTYTEDTSFNVNLGSITDLAGTSWPAETCGTGDGLNCYTLTSTIQGSYSGTNPITWTSSGTNVYTISGSKTTVNAAITALQLNPPADHTANIDIQTVVTRGNAPVTISTTTQTAVCTSNHGEFTVLPSVPFVLGVNNINLGSITDIAASKNYTVTLDAITALSSTRGSWADTTGLGVWNATGGVNGFGRLTITGTKAQVNASLAALTYTTVGGATLTDVQSYLYTQTQNTNVITQGTKTLSISNEIVWGTGNGIHNGVNAFVYNQDTATTWNLAVLGGIINTTSSYTVKVVLSTPLSTVNGGSISGWTRETDYIWTLTDVRANLNSALASLVINPPTALLSTFTVDIKVYDGATLIADSSALGSTRNAYLDLQYSQTWTSSTLSYNQDVTTTWSNVSTLNNLWNTIYTIRLVTSVACGGFTGWTTIDSTTFEKTDTKANLQTALNSLVFVPVYTLTSNFTVTMSIYRNSILAYTSGTKTLNIGTLYAITVNPATLTFNQDTTVTLNLATANANFGSSTYTITLTTSVANIGAFTGWTQTGAFTHTLTNTGPNIITKLAALEFVPAIAGNVSFTATLSAVKTGTTLCTSSAKNIAISQIYVITYPTVNRTYNQDKTQTYSSFATANSLFNNSRTYTFTIYTKAASGIAIADVGTFTGWTKTSSSTYTKTDIGANLIAACASLEFVSALTMQSIFQIHISVERAGVSMEVTSNDCVLTISNIYAMTMNTKSIVYNSVSNALTSIGTLNNNFIDTDSYVLTLESTRGTITGAGWTVISGTSLSATGTKTALQALLTSGITLETSTYLNVAPSITGYITKTGTEIARSASAYTIDNLPTVAINAPAGALWSNIRDSVGYTKNSLSYQSSTYTTENRDLFNLVQVSNIPNDGSLYQIVVNLTNSSIFGNIQSSGVTWSAEGTTKYVSSAATKANIDLALADMKLFAGSSAPTAVSNISNVQISIRAASPFIETFSNTKLVSNNAEIYITYAVGGTYFYGDSGTYSVGKLDFSPTRDGSYFRIDPTQTYSINIDMGGTGVVPVGWTSIGGNVYQLTGTPAVLDGYLKLFRMTATATTNRFVAINLYYGGVMLSTQGFNLRTN